MFYGFVGVLQNGRPAIENVEALTGFALDEAYDEEFKCPVLKIAEGGNPWLATKKTGEHTRVMSTDPRITSETLREIARAAGCHIYTDEDVILFGDEQMLGVFAKGETHTVLHLNGEKRATEIRTGKTLAGEHIQLDLAKDEFWILQYK